MGYEYFRCLRFEYIALSLISSEGQDGNMAVALFSLCDSDPEQSISLFCASFSLFKSERIIIVPLSWRIFRRTQ